MIHTLLCHVGSTYVHIGSLVSTHFSFSDGKNSEVNDNDLFGDILDYKSLEMVCLPENSLEYFQVYHLNVWPTLKNPSLLISYTINYIVQVTNNPTWRQNPSSPVSCIVAPENSCLLPHSSIIHWRSQIQMITHTG